MSYDPQRQRFQSAQNPMSESYILLIMNYMWWHTNEREILNWMVNNLPNGIDHLTGMVLNFDTEQQRTMFLLRWA